MSSILQSLGLMNQQPQTATQTGAPQTAQMPTGLPPGQEQQAGYSNAGAIIPGMQAQNQLSPSVQALANGFMAGLSGQPSQFQGNAMDHLINQFGGLLGQGAGAKPPMAAAQMPYPMRAPLITARNVLSAYTGGATSGGAG